MCKERAHKTRTGCRTLSRHLMRNLVPGFSGAFFTSLHYGGGGGGGGDNVFFCFFFVFFCFFVFSKFYFYLNKKNKKLFFTDFAELMP